MPRSRQDFPEKKPDITRSGKIEELRERRKQAAEKIRRLLGDLEAAEQEFEQISAQLKSLTQSR